jgi:hypothetical protein
MGLFGWLWQQIRFVFWALMPRRLRPESLLLEAKAGTDQAFEQARFRRVAAVVRWVLHVLLVLAALVFLWWLNRVYDLERVLRSPWRPLHSLWLPFLFLLAYTLGWLGWWLLRLLGQEPEAADFPDVVKAWGEALQALAAAGIDPTEAPLFLVLGRPARSVEDLFAAADLTLQVRHAPASPEAPLHVYASRSAVFVTCEGASLLGQAHALLAPEAAPDEATDAPVGDVVDGQGPDGGGAPPPNGAAAKAPAKVAAVAGPAGEAIGDGALLLEEPEADQALRVSRRRQLLLRNAGDLERQTARLKFLCRLIARRRQPYCPVNGVLLALPYCATDNAADAAQVGELCRQDLTAAREALRVHSPVQALVCDLETAAGFDELARRFPDPRQRQQLLGRRFPLLPRFPEGESDAAMIDGGVRWLCLEMLPALVYRQLRLEGPEGGPTLPEAVRVLAQGLAAEPGEPPLLGGCYLGATGPDSARDQAFVHGVFRLLLEDQNYVFWTAQAVGEDGHYRRLTGLAYAAVALLAAALIAVGYLLWIG